MRRFLAIAVLTGTALPLMAHEGHEHVPPTIRRQPAPEEEDWVTSYYLKPDPAGLLEKFKKLATDGSLENPSVHAPLIAFISQVMKANPKRIAGWLDALEKLKLGHEELGVFYNAAWFSNTKEARDYFRKKGITAFDDAPPDILKLEPKDPGVIDMWWGYFFATGSKAPIRRIVDALELTRPGEGSDRLQVATHGAVRWSLASNCRQHPRVMEYCKEILSKLPEAQRATLEKVLAEAEARPAR